MRINHNVAALNAWRNLSQTNGLLNKSLERLSSGLRINRAADDAAGLAISEKMRAQISGLQTAQRNAQDAISLIQTAEGALNESHSILQRMRELAVQAASDTNTAADRAQIQKEIDQLAQEIGRIARTTEFNTQKLLDGSFEQDGITFQIGANAGQNISVKIGNMGGFSLGVVSDQVKAQATVSATVTTGTTQDIADGTYTARSGASGGYELVDTSGTVVAKSNDGKGWTSTAGGADADTFTFSVAVTNGTVTIATSGTTTTATASTVVSFTNGGLEAGTYTYDATAKVLKDSSGNVVATEDPTTAGKFIDSKGNVVLDASGLGTLSDGQVFTVSGLDVTSQASASSAITAFDSAIESVSGQRADLGAIQNRLEHTIANLGVAVENLQAAESRIRDVDMALEMANFTRNQILLQSGTAMLAQANAMPQAVLQLLQG
ncbi:flagellin [Thermaerobacter subterraneus]|uniref:Flagellin n=1 Tax=Thermaerobacter subterraneus DSM 13965 TaxID=867903 RepID=K6QDB5_9FIRM|nr:flagellin [Thermaerobacter subterraneus]EKP94646.1 flagellin/flagellar hook associated protein [Thermaerobacter subterraneus DSM 13965]